MARIFTTPEAEKKAKVWLHDITAAAGLHANKRDQSYSRYWNSYIGKPEYITAAKDICDELVNRNFNNVDKSIREIARWGFYSPIEGSPMSTERFKDVQCAKALVYFAECLNFYWDDTIRTPYEIDEFKKTLLGDAVYKYKRYISAIPNKAQKSASNSASGSGKAAGQPPKNGYKSSGPQSGNVRDLQGQPGDKVIANGAFIYKIEGDKIKSNTPNVFIKPLSASGATGSTNKIFFSSGNGYTDCTCYFDDPNEAQTFLNKIDAAGRIPVDVVNPKVVKKKADPNGYFLVGTEFGVCAISAKTLNEALTESANNESKISWEKATEGYSKEELEELHTWMRRD